MWRFRSIILIASILLLQTALANFFSFPWRLIPVIMIFLIFRIFRGADKSLTWLIVIFGFFFELFRDAPFGANLLATLTTVGVGQWFAERILTNRTLPAILMLALLSSLVFRLMVVGITLLVALRTPTAETISFSGVAVVMIWEMAFTIFGTAFIYGIWRRNHTVSSF